METIFTLFDNYMRKEKTALTHHLFCLVSFLYVCFLPGCENSVRIKRAAKQFANKKKGNQHSISSM